MYFYPLGLQGIAISKTSECSSSQLLSDTKLSKHSIHKPLHRNKDKGKSLTPTAPAVLKPPFIWKKRHLRSFSMISSSDILVFFFCLSPDFVPLSTEVSPADAGMGSITDRV